MVRHAQCIRMYNSDITGAPERKRIGAFLSASLDTMERCTLRFMQMTTPDLKFLTGIDGSLDCVASQTLLSLAYCHQSVSALQ